MRKQTNYKLPEELITALQEKAAAERTTSTDLVIKALKSFLSNSEEEVSHIDHSISNLVQRIEELAERLDQLETSKNISFMHNSPLSEASKINISVDSDSINSSNTEEQFADLVKTIEELVQQNQSLSQRVAALETLIKKYNNPGLSDSID